MKQLYQIFGLNMLSEFELPAPQITSGLPDCEILLGTVSYPPTDYTTKGVCFYTRPKEVYFEIKDVARYFISNGNQIIVEPAPNADPSAISLFLNGPVFGALLLQKQMLPMHASSFEHNGEAILLCGNSGIGKSSLVAYLAKLGYNLIADDISAISFKNGELKLSSSGNYIKLWKDTLNKLELKQDGLKKARKVLEKFLYPVEPVNKNWKIKKIYLLRSHNQPGIQLTAIKGIQKFTTIKENTYRKIFIKGLALEKEYFSLAMQLANKTPMAELIRPNFGFHVEELAKTIFSDLEENGR